jgi:hypothetical protein
MTLISGAVGLQQALPDLSLLSGSWHRIRVQRFPDGRCGFAVDGKPVGILPRGHSLGRDVRVYVDGNSYRTSIAVGRLRVYEGVPRDIDWTKAKELR